MLEVSGNNTMVVGQMLLRIDLERLAIRVHRFVEQPDRFGPFTPPLSLAKISSRLKTLGF